MVCTFIKKSCDKKDNFRLILIQVSLIFKVWIPGKKKYIFKEI